MYVCLYISFSFFVVFNVGQYRRKMTNDFQSHEFFRSDNAEAMAMRARCAMDCLQDVCHWLENEGGEVAVSLPFRSQQS